MIAYAHQGGAWESPSSTLHAIAHALEAGATGIELDVHATADGELVVCHDATVDRTTAAHGHHRLVHAGRAAAAGLLVLVDPRGRRHARAARGRLPVPGPGAGRPVVRHRHAARGARAVPRGGAEPRHQADGAGGRPLRGVAGPAPGRVRAHRRRHRGLVPRPGHRRLPDASPRRCRPRPAPWPRPRPGGRSRPARRCPTSRRWPTRCPSARATWSWSTRRSWRRPTQPGKAVHVWTVNDAESWSACSASGSTGSSRTCHHAVRRAVGARGRLGRDVSARGLSAPGSAAAAVRLLAVVGLLLRPELALDRSLRHEATEPRRSGAGPSGSLGRMRSGWLLRDGDVVCALEMADSPAERGSPAGPDGVRGRAARARGPHRAHRRHEVPASTWPSSRPT